MGPTFRPQLTTRDGIPMEMPRHREVLRNSLARERPVQHLPTGVSLRRSCGARTTFHQSLDLLTPPRQHRHKQNTLQAKMRRAHVLCATNGIDLRLIGGQQDPQSRVAE